MRAVVLAASGRGFCAGVDIKEMQATGGHCALIGVNARVRRRQCDVRAARGPGRTSLTGPDTDRPGRALTIADVIGELRSGMTIGIGGWGSRRKPMALVRAILRPALSDLTVVSLRRARTSAC